MTAAVAHFTDNSGVFASWRIAGEHLGDGKEMSISLNA